MRAAIALRFFAVLGLLLGLALIFAELFAPTLSIRFDATQVRHEDSFAYVVPVRVRSHLLFQLRSDYTDKPSASTLRLLEEGKPLGPAHSAHTNVRQQGAGRFSHWSNALWFSSSDGTDPTANGRTYLAEARLNLRPAWTAARTAALAAALLILVIEAIKQLSGPRCARVVMALRRLTALLGSPRSHTRRVAALAGALGAVVCTAAVIYGWYAGDTSITGLGVARFLPVSDALGYHICATWIAAGSSLDTSPIADVWCSRRVLYPAMLASLFSFTAWNSQLALVAQGALVGVAVAMFSLAASAVAGPVAALVVAVLLFLYAWEFVLGLFMTEVLGFTLSLCGLTLLLGFCKTKQSWHLFAGILLVSVGLAARAGALLLLPIFPVWAFLSFSGASALDRTKYFFIALLGALAGPLIQLSMVSLLGADASNTGGNFSASLYGLSTGSRDWSQAYRDFDALFKQSEADAFREVYKIAWHNIVDRPGIFIEALAEAGRLYFKTLFTFIANPRYNELLTLLAGLGAIRCILDAQFPVARLIIALAFAEILSAPLIIDSGGLRVFAVTVAVRILLCALGLQWLLQLVSRALSGERSASLEMSGAAPSLSVAVATGAFILILIFSPATPLAEIGQLKRVAGLGCPAGSKEIVARLANESQSLAIVEGNSIVESFDPFRITPQRLRNDSRLKGTWFGDDFLRLSPPFTIVRAVDLSDPSAFNVKPLFFRGVLNYQSDPQSLCVDEQSFIEFAQIRHYLIKEIRPLRDRP